MKSRVGAESSTSSAASSRRYPRASTRWISKGSRAIFADENPYEIRIMRNVACRSISHLSRDATTVV